MPFFPSPRSRGTIHRTSPAGPGLLVLLGLGILLILPSPTTALGDADGSGAGAFDAAPPEALQTPASAAKATAATGTAGLRVFVDPVTGELVSRPSESQVRRLQQAIDELDVGEPVTDLHPFPLGDGGTGVYVGDRFMTSTVVRRAEDGSLVMDCTTDPDHRLHRHPPLAPLAAAPAATTRRSDAPVM